MFIQFFYLNTTYLVMSRNVKNYGNSSFGNPDNVQHHLLLYLVFVHLSVFMTESSSMFISLRCIQLAVHPHPSRQGQLETFWTSAWPALSSQWAADLAALHLENTSLDPYLCLWPVMAGGSETLWWVWLEDCVMIKKLEVSVPCIRSLGDGPKSRLYFINEITMQI